MHAYQPQNVPHDLHLKVVGKENKTSRRIKAILAKYLRTIIFRILRCMAQ